MSSKKQLLAQFSLHNVLFNNVLDQITDEEANTSIAPPMNSFKWLAGHVLNSQGHLATLSGVDIAIPWARHFAAKATDVKTVTPTLAEIKAKWNEIHPQLQASLENLSEEALNQAIEIPHPIAAFDNTLGGFWAFINHHQAYTIGQMGILRRGFNKDAMKYS